MAASDFVIAVRKLFRLGDIAYRRTASESIMGSFAAQSNFINKYQTDMKEFKLNGPYSVATGLTFYDGAASFFFNTEVVGYSIYNGKSGVSGTTTFDVQWKNAAGVNQGSIYSSNPTINSTSSDETVAMKNLETGNDFTMTGVGLGTLSKTTFLEGESIFFKITGSMATAQNCGLTIYYRPTN